MDRYAGFSGLFGSFDGYVDHFHLGDFVDASGAVRFLLPFDNFESPVLPSDLPTYARYRLDRLELFEARRLRILNAIRQPVRVRLITKSGTKSIANHVLASRYGCPPR
jgi:hypothetical protein